MSKSNVSARGFKSVRFYFFVIFSLFASITFAVQLPGFVSEASDKNLSETSETALANQAKPSVSILTPDAPPEKPHTLVGSYYDTENFPAAKLLLNNKDIVAREVRPTLYGLDGQVIDLPPVQVEAESFRLINLKDWADFAGNGFGRGSVKLFHTGKDLVIGSQIYLEDEAQSLSFEEKLQEIGNFDSRRLEGVWFQPSNQTASKIVISNVSAEFLSVTVTPSRRPHIVGSSQIYTLQPHQARVIDLREEFGNAFGNSEAVGVSITHNGTASALIARALVSEAAKGYSTVVTFRNPDTAKSSQLHGAGVKLGAIGGDLLKPVLIVRNTSQTNTSVKVNVPYTRADGTSRVIYMDEVELRGNEIKQINLDEITQIAGTGGVVETAGIEVKNQTADGNFVAQMQSISNSRKQSFRVILWDAASQKTATGGYPWLIDGNSSTKAYIKNVTYYGHYYVSYITWANGGMYMIGIRKLAPHQTVEIDVRKIRDEQIPDEEGRTIPPDVSAGQIQWTRKIQGTTAYDDSDEIPLVGQMEQTDTVKGISSSYFCQNCCINSSFGYIQPVNVQAPLNTEVQFDSYEEGTSCYGGRYIYSTTSLATWTSTNQSVATLVGQGRFQTQGVGETTIKAKFRVTNHYQYEPCPGGGGPYLVNGGEEFSIVKEDLSNIKKIAGEANRPAPCSCICTSPEVEPDTRLTVTGVTVASLSASISGNSDAAFTTTNNVHQFATGSTDLMVVFKGGDVINVAAQNINPSNAGNLIKWVLQKDPNGTFDGTALPTLSAQVGQNVSITPTKAGNFMLISYHDRNNNGTFEAGEQLRILKFAVVAAQVETALCTITAYNSFEGETLGFDQYKVKPSVPTRINCSYLLQSGGSNNSVGLDKVHMGNIANLTSIQNFVGYDGGGNAIEHPVAGGGDSIPLVVTDNVILAGGYTVFRADSMELNPNGPGRQVRSDAEPDIGPFITNVAGQMNDYMWSSTNGSLFITEFIGGFSDTFPNYIVAAAKVPTQYAIAGDNNHGEWMDNGNSAIFLNNMPVSTAGTTVSFSALGGSQGTLTPASSANMRVNGTPYDGYSEYIYAVGLYNNSGVFK
jgi:hypothetical protein